MYLSFCHFELSSYSWNQVLYFLNNFLNETVKARRGRLYGDPFSLVFITKTTTRQRRGAKAEANDLTSTASNFFHFNRLWYSTWMLKCSQVVIKSIYPQRFLFQKNVIFSRQSFYSILHSIDVSLAATSSLRRHNLILQQKIMAQKSITWVFLKLYFALLHSIAYEH